MGITPADAGKTWGSYQICRKVKDHPRGCGENSGCISSKNDFNRITPADAGKTCKFRSFSMQSTGSPPRMRGKPMPQLRLRVCARITPADAGKTIPAAIGCHRVKDHPRGCGENTVLGFCCNSALGSPPRMRGKLSKYLSIGF